MYCDKHADLTEKIGKLEGKVEVLLSLTAANFIATIGLIVLVWLH